MKEEDNTSVKITVYALLFVGLVIYGIYVLGLWTDYPLNHWFRQ